MAGSNLEEWIKCSPMEQILEMRGVSEKNSILLRTSFIQNMQIARNI